MLVRRVRLIMLVRMRLLMCIVLILLMRLIFDVGGARASKPVSRRRDGEGNHGRGGHVRVVLGQANLDSRMQDTACSRQADKQGRVR